MLIGKDEIVHWTKGQKEGGEKEMSSRRRRVRDKAKGKQLSIVDVRNMD